ncbi:MAG: PD-(D/E)XK nuclease family protein [Candidatus Paceibacteria bacterium]
MADSFVRLSPSSLNLFLDCPRCFYLEKVEGIKRPETPASTLPSGIDNTLKKYFDYWRQKDALPPLLQGKLPGRLVSEQALIAKFRSRSFEYYDSAVDAHFAGILDDALILEDGSIVPIDNKTRGFPPQEPHESHLNQMSGYTLLLLENGFQTKNLAYLIYWFFNHKEMDLENPMAFNITVEEVKTDPENIRRVFHQAVKILKGPIPPVNSLCTFCAYRQIGK